MDIQNPNQQLDPQLEIPYCNEVAKNKYIEENKENFLDLEGYIYRWMKLVYVSCNEHIALRKIRGVVLD